MKCEFTITIDDYKAAGRLYRKRKPLLRFARFLVLWCTLPIGLWLIAWSIHAERICGHKPSIIGAIVLFAVLLFPSFWEYYTTRKSFSFMSAKMGNGLAFDIDEGGIKAKPGDEMKQPLSWDRIVSFDSDDRIAIFYMRKGYFFFPMRVLDPAQRAELNDLVARHVVKK